MRTPSLLTLGVLVGSSTLSFAQNAQTPPKPAVAPAPASKPRVISALPEKDEAPEVVVYLKDGRQFKGLLAPSKPDEVVIRIAGIEARFTTAEVERYQVLPSVFERYRELRAAVGDDPDQIARLAEWLQSRERYELALSEVLRALTIDENHVDSKRLKNLLEEQIRLKAAAIKPAAEPDAKNADKGPEPERPRDFPLLTPAQINLIKVFELELADNPRILISRAAVERLLDAYVGNPSVPATREGRDALLHRPATESLALMYELRAREFYSEVQVQDQPKSMAMFRDGPARTWLKNSCGTTECHGGLDAGRLVLANQRTTADPALYTNFLILSLFKTQRGQPLINWDVPERSPLVQLGLPREQSLFPHPEVPRGIAQVDAWKPAFRKRADPMFAATIDWIKAMHKPRSDYAIDYRPIRPFEAESKQAVDPPKKGSVAKPVEPPATEPKPR